MDLGKIVVIQCSNCATSMVMKSNSENVPHQPHLMAHHTHGSTAGLCEPSHHVQLKHHQTMCYNEDTADVKMSTVPEKQNKTLLR